jgi:hypothetical protein
MIRILVLSFPLLVIWLALNHGLEDQKFSGESAPDRGFGKEVDEKFSSPAGRLMKEGIESARGILPQPLQIRSLAKSRKDLQPIAPERAGTAELVDEILAEISPGHLEKLAPRDFQQLRRLIARATSPSARDQAWLCWAEDVPKEKAMAFHEAERFVGLSGPEYALFANQFLSGGKWSRTATDGFTGGVQGSPEVVTWSIVPDGTLTPGLEGQQQTGSNLRSWLTSIYGGSTTGPAADQPWFFIFESSFEAMAATCGVTLRYEENDDGRSIRSSRQGLLGVRGDIRIAARTLDGDSDTLAFAFSPDYGDMIFDSDDSTFDDTSSTSLRLYNIIGHELGHCLGLAHVCPLNRSKLMEPILSTNFRGPRFDEFQSLQRLYGDLFESNGDIRSNDSSASASDLGLEVGQTTIITRLSIDDNTDVDFYEFTALPRQTLTVTLDPGEGSYLEGDDSSAGCSSGVSFRSAEVHDLGIDILAEDGSTVLISASAAPLGGLEQIRSFKLPDEGRYFIKVNGDQSDAAQLYQMSLRLDEAFPAVELEEGVGLIVAESGSVKNKRLDPGETIKVTIPIANEGALVAEDLRMEVVSSDNITLFSAGISPQILPSGEGLAELVFGAAGDCGELADLTVRILSGMEELLEFDQQFVLGNVGSQVVLSQSFDASNLLPDGWTSENSGAGIKWDPVSARSVSPIRSVFAEGVPDISESSLISPPFTLVNGQGLLSFTHAYLTETGFDGGVLEVSRDGGAWTDLIEDPAVAVTGGYDREIRSSYGSAIGGRQAWSARSGNFMTTSVIFPGSWNGEELRLRWRLVHDSSGSGEGWWIDDIVVSAEIADCEVHRPFVELNILGGGLNENFPERGAVLSLTSELPLLQDLAIVLERSGTASPADFEGDLEVILPAGQESLEVLFSVVTDNRSEGEETLIITLPDDRSNFAPGGQASGTITILDLSGIASWAAAFFPASVDFSDDADGDGLSELAEYLLGTDPTSRLSPKILNIKRSEDSFIIPLGSLPNRPDATLGVEYSNNLHDWVTGALQVNDEGIIIDPPEGKSYARLTFSLNQ